MLNVSARAFYLNYIFVRALRVTKYTVIRGFYRLNYVYFISVRNEKHAIRMSEAVHF